MPWNCGSSHTASFLIFRFVASAAVAFATVIPVRLSTVSNASAATAPRRFRVNPTGSSLSDVLASRPPREVLRALVSLRTRTPLDDLDVVAVRIGHGPDQPEWFLLHLTHEAGPDALQVLAESTRVVDVEVHDHAGRFLRGPAHLAVRLDEELHGAELEGPHVVLLDVEGPAVPGLHLVGLRRADEQAPERWYGHRSPPMQVVSLSDRNRVPRGRQDGPDAGAART